MSHCPKCGVLLPIVDEVRFCPNCGNNLRLKTREKYDIMSVYSTYKGSTPSRISTKRRIQLFILVFFICLLATSIGTVTIIDASTAQELVDETNNLQDALKIAGVPIVFGNNMMHSLIMFIPGIGPIWGLFVLYNTGTVIAAFGTTTSVNAFFLFASLFITPFAWMEYISYSLALSESFLLVYSLFKGGWRLFRIELKTTYKFVTVCAILLLLGAIMEIAMILNSMAT